MVERYFRFILRHRIAVLLLMAVITAVSGWMLTKGVFSSSIGKMFLGEDPAYKHYLDRIAQFGGNEIAVASFETKNPLVPSEQKKLKKAVQAIAALEGVHRVSSVLDLDRISEAEDTLLIQSYADSVLEHPDSADDLWIELTRDEFAKGLLVSNDGRYTSLVIEIDSASDLPAETAPAMMEGILKSFQAAGYDPDSIHLVGMPMSVAAIVNQTYFNLTRIFPFAALVLVLVVWVLFRRFWPVVMTMTVALLAVIWTMGFAVTLDRNISILASAIPSVILVISFSDVVHLCSAYLLELSSGKDKNAAILASGIDVGKACIWTSMTTFTGFVAMSFIPAPVFRQMGVVLGVGVAAALLIAMTLVPILFSIIRRPKPWRVGATGQVQDLLDRVLSAFSALGRNRPKFVLAGFVMIFLASCVGLTQIYVETDFIKRLSEDHRLRKDADFFQTHFDGATLLDIFIEMPEQDAMLDKDTFDKVAEFQQRILAMEQTTSALSLVDLLKKIHGTIAPELADQSSLPPSRQAIAQYMLLFESSGGEDLDRLIDGQRRTLHLAVQLPEQAVRNASATGDRIRELADELLPKNARTEVTGIVYLMGKWLDNILAGQRRGLIFAIAVIALMMVWGLGSWRAGLWSMAPNILPLIFLGGYLGLFWKQVDSDLLGLAMIAIGIGVDDTIHFLMRFKIESARQPDVATAIDRTYHFSGRGIVLTTLILVAGFLPFVMSSYLSIRVFGTLLPMTLIVALAADLLLVPAMVQLGLIRFEGHTRKDKSI